MNKYDINSKISNILMKSRYASGRSQEYVAGRLGVSVKTIQNWENSKSMPDVAQLYNWFNAVQIPPQPYFLEILYPNLDVSDSDGEFDDTSFLKLIRSLPIHEKKKLLFILQGNHGSSPSCVVDMMVANLQTPLRDRMGVCQTIISNYEISETLDVLTDKEAVRPSVSHLKEVLQAALTAVQKKQRSYLK